MILLIVVLKLSNSSPCWNRKGKNKCTIILIVSAVDILEMICKRLVSALLYLGVIVCMASYRVTVDLPKFPKNCTHADTLKYHSNQNLPCIRNWNDNNIHKGS